MTQNAMKKYGSSEKSSVLGYEDGIDFIVLHFKAGSSYLYSADRNGSERIATMKALAAKGRGLATFISRSADLGPSRHESAAALFVQSSNEPLSSVICVNAEREVLRYFASHPEKLRSMPPRKFEELVASIFRLNGFQVEITPETRDGGLDVLLVRQDALLGSSLHLVECKRYHPENRVGIGVVQRMLGVVEQHRATSGIIVTTSSFTADARRVEAVTKHRLSLSDYENLVSWLAAFREA